MSLAPGSRLGPYEVIAALGAGGMGEVYRARDTRLDRSVAIKVLPAHVTTDPERRARFAREAKTIAALNHPHICTLYDVGESGDTTYLVMEHLTGETLAQRLEKGPLPLEQALSVAIEIADALSAAHRRDVIHRDLKPGNVMLTKTGAKLLDFGLAKLKAHGEQAAVSFASAPTRTAPLTSEGEIVGTLHYMAPEQVEGKPADARTDLWALGAILYEMLAGKRAFEGTSAAALIGNIMNAEPPALATLQPPTPPALERLVRKCLAKDRDDRWDSSHDVADELRWLAETARSTAAADHVRPRRLPWFVGGLALGVAVVTAGVVATRVARPIEPQGATGFRQLTYQRGQVLSARFTADGQTIVYTARWRGEPARTFLARLDQSEAQAQPLVADAVVAGVRAGQVLVLRSGGRLATGPLLGGATRDLAQGVAEADFGPSGDPAIVRAPSAQTGGRFRLEYPPGRVLWESDTQRGGTASPLAAP